MFEVVNIGRKEELASQFRHQASKSALQTNLRNSLPSGQMSLNTKQSPPPLESFSSFIAYPNSFLAVMLRDIFHLQFALAYTPRAFFWVTFSPRDLQVRQNEILHVPLHVKQKQKQNTGICTLPVLGFRRGRRGSDDLSDTAPGEGATVVGSVGGGCATTSSASMWSAVQSASESANGSDAMRI